MFSESVASEKIARRSGTSVKPRSPNSKSVPSKADTAQTSFAISAVGATQSESDEELRRLRDLFN